MSLRLVALVTFCAYIRIASAQLSDGNSTNIKPEAVNCPRLGPVECTLDNGESIPCGTESAVPPNTTAQLVCQNGAVKRFLCRNDSQWDPSPIDCLPTNDTHFPWHASLYRQKNQEVQFMCGATVIKNNMLLTAAHCVYDEENSKVDNRDSYFVFAGDTESKFAWVKSIHVPDSYNGQTGNFTSDIAIVEITEPLEFSDSLMPICLDTNDATDQTALQAGNYGRVPGANEPTTIADSRPMLQALSLPIMSQADCRNKSDQSKIANLITPDKFCVGYTNGTSICNEGTGNGLVFETDGKWYLIGIPARIVGSVTGGGTTCQHHEYSLYTLVAHHMTWIQKSMKKDLFRNLTNMTNMTNMTNRTNMSNSESHF